MRPAPVYGPRLHRVWSQLGLVGGKETVSLETLHPPAHYTLNLYWNHTGMKRKMRLGNEVWPFLSVESRAGCHTHTQ